MFFVFSLLLAAISYGLSRLVLKTKLAMRHRVLHIRYVFFTIVYSVAGVFLFAKLLLLLDKFFSLSVVRDFIFSIIPASNSSAGFFWMITLVCCILLMAIYALMMFLLYFLWLKRLCARGNYFSSRSIIERAFNALSAVFYEMSSSGSSLPPVYYNLGQWISFARKAFGFLLLGETVLVSLYLQFDLTFIDPERFALIVKSLYMIPVLSYIILQQIELFLSADNKSAEILIDTEEVGSVQVGDYTGLVGLYDHYFGGKSLISFIKKSREEEIQNSLFSSIEKEQLERAKNPELLEAVCRNVNNAIALSAHYINGLIELINGNNIAVFDTYCGEFDFYYLAYVQHILNMRKTVLIVCDTEAQVEEMKKRCTSVFKKINRVHHIWKIHGIEDLVDGDTDILICTEEQIFCNSLQDRCPDFYSKITLVAVIDSYGLLCRENAFISRFFNELVDKKIQYVFYIPENNTDLKNELQEHIGNEAISLCENFNSNSNTCILFWRGESLYKPQRAISEKLTHDFGVAYTIAVIASNYDVSAISIISPDSIPSDTYYDLVTKEYAKVISAEFFKSNKINLDNVISNNSFSVTDESALSFTIVYDSNNNLLNVAKLWLSYGGKSSSMLHIVSAPYMFRDYFATNMSTLCSSASGVQLLVPDDKLNFRMTALGLLLKMRRGVSSEELLDFAVSYGIKEKRTENILEEILKMAFGEDTVYSVYNSFSFVEDKYPDFENKQYIYEPKIILTDESLYKRVCKMTGDYVQLTGSYEEILSIHKSNVYNHYLPGQCASFGNIRFRIDAISDGVIHLKKEETVDMENDYTSLYDITGASIIREIDGLSVYKTNYSTLFYEMEISRSIAGYVAYPGVIDFTNKTATVTEILPVPITERKKISCMKLMLNCPFDCNPERLAATIVFLLQGAMKTFLPNNYKDLLIFSKINKSVLTEGIEITDGTVLLSDPVPSDIEDEYVENQIIDKTLIDMMPDVDSEELIGNDESNIHIYFAHFSSSEFGVLSAIANDIQRIFSTIGDYLVWSENIKESEKDKYPLYLAFGYDRIPGIFDVQSTMLCLDGVVVKTDETLEELDGFELAGSDSGRCCTFCGNPIVTTYFHLDDERIMCPDCHSHVASSRDEIKKILTVAISTLETKYLIKLPDDIKIKFKSATAIRKHLGIMEGGRVLGFYNSKKHEIWIERNGPEACVMSTVLHELTHAWQYANLDFSNPKLTLAFIEGHSTYVEIEGMYERKQARYASFLDRITMARDDEYGIGYRFWKDYISAESDKNIFNHMKNLFGK